jgi:hypothetical protein
MDPKGNLLKKNEMVDLILFKNTNKICLTRPNDLFETHQVHRKYIEAFWNGWM